MSDGPLGSGLAYYAAFEITGDLDQECLKRIIAEIKTILEGECKGHPVKGKILKSVRVSSTTISDGQQRVKGKAKINISID
jgi:hypothetical protein